MNAIEWMEEDLTKEQRAKLRLCMNCNGELRVRDEEQCCESCFGHYWFGPPGLGRLLLLCPQAYSGLRAQIMMRRGND